MAIAVGVCALLFTVASFWWIQLRRGRLVSFEPQTYSGYVQAGAFRLRLPLTIYNTGAVSLVVTDLRVVFTGDGQVAPAITFRSTLKPLSSDVIDFVHPFPVRGREAVTKYVEFGSRSWAPEQGTCYEISVGLRTGDDGKWTQLLRTQVTTPSGEGAGAYITHRRDPDDEAPEPGAWEIA